MLPRLHCLATRVVHVMLTPACLSSGEWSVLACWYRAHVASGAFVLPFLVICAAMFMMRDRLGWCLSITSGL